MSTGCSWGHGLRRRRMTTTTTELYGRRKVEGGSTRNKRPRGVQRFPD
tara:strand:- start:5 stop:148 length:144 start_codon:yes stop_codon:yes gene_type:complete